MLNCTFVLLWRTRCSQGSCSTCCDCRSVHTGQETGSWTVFWSEDVNLVGVFNVSFSSVTMVTPVVVYSHHGYSRISVSLIWTKTVFSDWAEPESTTTDLWQNLFVDSFRLMLDSVAENFSLQSRRNYSPSPPSVWISLLLLKTEVCNRRDQLIRGIDPVWEELNWTQQVFQLLVWTCLRPLWPQAAAQVRPSLVPQ